MIIDKSEQQVKRGGTGPESTFSIKASAKSFEILSSKLYTDPILAVIRELSCNAYDAHVVAGRADTPFEIHLPNELEPFFSVADYGTGLSHEQIVGTVHKNEDGSTTTSGGLYTTYFDSTKTQSNDFIGALGLGSKSPFSYVTAFMVTSWYNSTKTIYSIFLNEDGIPSVAVQGTFDSDRENGIEVKITVNSPDFYQFSNKTASILRYFPVKPTILGQESFVFDGANTISSLKQDNVWELHSCSVTSNHLIIVQGHVPYDVNIHQLRSSLTKSEWNFLLGVTVTLFFDIGQIEVAANREEIRYEVDNINVIVDRLQQCVREVGSRFDDIIDKTIKTDSLWEFIDQIEELSNKVFNNRHFIYSSSSIFSNTKHELLAKTISITGKIPLIFPLELYDKDEEARDLSSLRTLSLSKYSDRNFSMKLVKQPIMTPSMYPGKRWVVMLNDVPNGGIKRAGHWLNQSTHDNILMITPIKDANPVLQKTEMQAVINMLGNPTVHKLSETCPAVKTDITSITDKNIFYRVANTGWRKTTGINTIPSGKKLYCKIRFGSRIYNSRDKRIDNWGNFDENRRHRETMYTRLQRVVNMHNQLEPDKNNQFSIDRLYGVNQSALSTVENDPDWFNIFDVLEDVIERTKEDWTHYIKIQKIQNAYITLLNVIENKPKDIEQQVSTLSDSSLFKQQILPVIEKYKTLSSSGLVSGLKNRTLMESYDKDFGKRAIKKDGISPYYDEDQLVARYPMLKFVGYGLYSPKEINTMIQYIKLIDTEI